MGKEVREKRKGKFKKKKWEKDLLNAFNRMEDQGEGFKVRWLYCSYID